MQTDLLGFTNNVPIGSSIEGLNSDVIGFKDAAFTWRYASEANGTSTPNTERSTLHIENELIFKKHGINLITGPTGSGIMAQYVHIVFILM